MTNCILKPEATLLRMLRPSILLALSLSLLFVSPPIAVARTLYRSADGGLSFSQVVSGMGADLEIAANGDVFGSTGIGSSSTGKLYKSVDDGVNWNQITSIPAGGQRMEIATAPSDANRVYVIAVDGVDVSWRVILRPRFISFTPLRRGSEALLARRDYLRFGIF